MVGAAGQNAIEAAFVITNDGALKSLEAVSQASKKTATDMEHDGGRIEESHNRIEHTIKHLGLAFLGLHSARAVFGQIAHSSESMRTIMDSLFGTIGRGIDGLVKSLPLVKDLLNVIARGEEERKLEGIAEQINSIEEGMKRAQTLLLGTTQVTEPSGWFGKMLFGQGARDVTQMAFTGIGNDLIAGTKKTYSQLAEEMQKLLPSFAKEIEAKRALAAETLAINHLYSTSIGLSAELAQANNKDVVSALNHAKALQVLEKAANDADDQLRRLSRTDLGIHDFVAKVDSASMSAAKLTDMLYKAGLTEQDLADIAKRAQLEAQYEDIAAHVRLMVVEQDQAGASALYWKDVLEEVHKRIFDVKDTIEKIPAAEKKAADGAKQIADGWQQAVKNFGDVEHIKAQIANALTSDVENVLTNIIEKTKSWRDIMADVLRSFARIAFNQAGLGFSSAIGNLLGFGGGGSGGAAGAATNYGLGTAEAKGDAFSGGRIIPFAGGGIVSRATLAPMALFGEAGPEAIVPLSRTRSGKLGIASEGGGGGNTFNIHIHAMDAPSFAAYLQKNGKDAIANVIMSSLSRGDALGSALRAA